MKKVTNGFRKGITAISLLLLCCVSSMTIRAQTLLAGWDFQTTTNGGTAIAAAPSTPTTIVANFGTGSMYFDGTNGSSSWITAVSGNELTGFSGTAFNAGPGFSIITTSPACLGLVKGASTNGKFIVIKFSMAGYKDLVISYATQKSATGFGSQTWEYSTNGSTWSAVQTLSTIPTSFATQTLSTITGLDNATTAYLRLTVTGATATGGTNRIDNLQLNASSFFSSTDYFRSFQTGNWASLSTWESSPDAITWASAIQVPTSSAYSVQIQNGHTVTVSSNVSAQRLTVDAGGVLIHTSGASLSIKDEGTSAYDFSINGRYELNGTVPTYSVGTERVAVNNGAEVRVTGNTPSSSDDFARDTHVYFNTGSVFNWQYAGVNTFKTNITPASYFPNATATDKAIFRVSANIPGTVGANTDTKFNGKFEIASGYIDTFKNAGKKIFRDGLGGGGTLVHSNNCGLFEITSPTAVIDGTLTVNLNNSSGYTLQISSGASVTVSGSPTINVGTVASPSAILYIASGATLLHNGSVGINIAKGALSVDGTIASSGTGTFTGSQTAMVFFGATGVANALRFTPGSFNNYVSYFSAAGGGTATLANTLNIPPAGWVETTTGGVLNSNGFLTLKSDATGTARVTNSTGTINGNVTTERYIPAKRAWRLLTSSVAPSATQTINAAWQEGATPNPSTTVLNDPKPGYGTQITKNKALDIANGFDANWQANPSIYSMDNAATAIIPSTYIPINTYRSYFLFVRGSRANQIDLGTTAPTSTTTLRTTGPINQGDVSANVTISNGQYFGIGNPYPSAIDITGILTGFTGSTNVDATTFARWDPGINPFGGYIQYVGGVSSPSTTNYPTTASTFVMQSGEAFILKASGVNPVVKFKESLKTTANSSTVFARPAPPTVHINLYDSSMTQVDGVAIGFADSASVPKFGKTGELMMISVDNALLGIQIQPLHKVDTFRFEFMKLNNQTYHLRLTQELKDLDADLELVDLFLHTHIELKGHTDGYAFTVTADTASYKHRFMLIAKAKHIHVQPPHHHHDKDLSVYPNPTHGKISITIADKPYVGPGTITDISGRVLREVVLTHGTTDCSFLTSGVYYLQLKDGRIISFIKL